MSTSAPSPSSSLSQTMCSICCEEEVNVTSMVTCLVCKFSCCRSCIQRSLLSSNVEPHCIQPQCRHPWSYSFLTSILPRTFLYGPFAKHFAAFLEARESQFLQRDRQVVAAKHLCIRSVIRERELDAAVLLIRNQLDVLNHGLCQTSAKQRKQEKHVLLASLKNLRAQVVKCAEDKASYKSMMGRLEHGTDGLSNGSSKSNDNEKWKESFACPATGCDGMAMPPVSDLSPSIKTSAKCREFTCSKCDKHLCRACRCEFLDHHQCDPNTLESLKAIQKDSKGCPKCRALIFKIEGCDQMHCVMCHHNFYWTTLAPITGHIHNPHYFQWLTEQAANGTAQAIPEANVGGCVRSQYERDFYICCDLCGVCEWFNTFVRNMRHHTDREFPRSDATSLQYSRDTNKAARRDYSMGVIDKTIYLRRLISNYREVDYKREMRQIWDTFMVAAMDIVAAGRRGHTSSHGSSNKSKRREGKWTDVSFCIPDAFQMLSQYISKEFYDLNEKRQFKVGIKFTIYTDNILDPSIDWLSRVLSMDRAIIGIEKRKADDQKNIEERTKEIETRAEEQFTKQKNRIKRVKMQAEDVDMDHFDDSDNVD